MHINSRPVCKLQNLERWPKEFEFKTNIMVFLSMCYSLSVNMPRTHTQKIGEGGGWRSEHCGGVQSLRSIANLIIRGEKHTSGSTDKSLSLIGSEILKGGL